MHGHNIVVVKVEEGTVDQDIDASSAIKTMQSTFRAVRSGLMVSIGQGQAAGLMYD
jgi:hypothetical protein